MEAKAAAPSRLAASCPAPAPSSSSHSCLREETAKPPADVPFFLLPLSHTQGHGSSLRPQGPHRSNFCLNFLICEVGAMTVPALEEGAQWALDELTQSSLTL